MTKTLSAEKIRKFFSENKYPLIAFAVAEVILLIGLAICSCAPFGKNSLLSLDLWTQYYPMIQNSLRSLFGGGNLWSWNGGLGFNAFAQNAYYTSGAFNLLIAPFSGVARLAVFDLIITLKISLSALTFAYLCRRIAGKNTPLVIVFSLPYALGAYTTAYISQVMWLDCVWLLPLVLLGIHRLADDKKPLLFIASLSAAIISNFFIGYAVCLFAAIYYIAYIISRSGFGLKRTLCDTARFAYSSLSAGAIGGIVIIPALFAISKAASSSMGFNKNVDFYHSLPTLIDNTAFGVKPSLEYGAANIFCISAALFIVLIFLSCGKIPPKRRVCMFLISAFMLLSFELNLLDYVWHGLHFTNQLPNRQSFAFILIMLLMGFEAVLHIKEWKFLPVCGAFVASVIVYLIGLDTSKYQSQRKISLIILTLYFIAAAGVLLYKSKRLRRASAYVFCALIILESSASAIYQFSANVYVSDAEYYTRNDGYFAEMTKKYGSKGKNELYRTDVVPRVTFNGSQLYGFKGLTYYSSTMNKSVYDCLEGFGYGVYAKNVSTLYQPSPLTDMFFGIKYLYSGDDKSYYFHNETEKFGAYTVLENPYALPISFCASDDVKSFEFDKYDVMLSQNEFLGLLSGGINTVNKLIPTKRTSENAFTYYDESKQYFNSDDTSEDSVFVCKFKATGAPLYLSAGFRTGKLEIFADDEKLSEYSMGLERIIPLGAVDKGTEISIKVTTSGIAVGLYGIDLYEIDENALKNAYNTLSAGGIDIEYASDVKIKGTVNCEKNGTLFSSIPDDGGWKVFIDGKEAQTYAVAGALLCADITAGEHYIEYRYSVPGLNISLAVFAAGLLGAAAAVIVPVIKRRKLKSR